MEWKQSNYQSIYGRENKYCVPVSSQFSYEPLPFAGVFELVKTENEEIEINQLKNLKGFIHFINHTYRNFFILD